MFFKKIPNFQSDKQVYIAKTQNPETMETEKRFQEPGTPQPDPKYHIRITPEGPYLVFGNPPLQQEILTPDEEKIPWGYAIGQQYATEDEPTAFCRCGISINHPYCDGSHATAHWDPTLSADNLPVLDLGESYDGPTLQLADNPEYCAGARICMAHGTAWHNKRHSDQPEKRDLAIHGSTFCPAGRLKIWDKEKEAFIEPPLKPELGLIEDPQKQCSGPLWVKGGIPVASPETAYEQRNRITLCRCGASDNKPFCDGTHVSVQFNDHLPLVPEAGEEEQDS